ncbi:MAG: O-antigen ligase family protein, partial [Fusobacteriaceae bacterium]
ETFATQGLITLILYLLFLSSIIFYSVKNYFSEKTSSIKNIKFLTIGVFIFGMLYGLAEAIIYFTKIYMMLFTIISINFINVEEDERPS